MTRRNRGGKKGKRTASVSVYRTTDPMRAQLLAEFLEQQGIPARHVGTRHGAGIGVAQHILKQRIEVPEDRLDEAREVVADFETAHGAEPQTDEADRQLRRRHVAGGDGQDDDSGAPAPAPVRLSRILAAGLVPVVPGGGHFYARNSWIGAVIVLGWIIAITVPTTWRDGGPFAATAIVLLLVFDLVDAQLAVGDHNSGRPRTRGAQLLRGFGSLAVILVLGVVAGVVAGR